MLIFIGFRGFVSTDWYSYYPAYEDIQIWNSIDFKYLKSFGWEIGTPLMMYMLKKMGMDYFGFCFVNAFLDLCIIYRFFSRYSKNIYLSWVFFILYGGLGMEFNLLRNTKAIDLFLLSLDYIDNKYWKYFFLNILGLYFHTTAVFFLAFFFIYKSNFIKMKKIILILWIIGMIIYVLKISYINLILNSFVDYLPGRMRWLVHRYTTYNKHLKSYGFGLGFLERVVTFLLIYRNHEKLIQKNNENKIFLVMIYLYFFVYLYLAEIFELTARLTTLTGFSYWILYPALYNLFSNKKKKHFIIILTFYSLLKLYAVFGTDISFEYENILFGAQSFHERYQNNLKYRL